MAINNKQLTLSELQSATNIKQIANSNQHLKNGNKQRILSKWQIATSNELEIMSNWQQATANTFRNSSFVSLTTSKILPDIKTLSAFEKSQNIFLFSQNGSYHILPLNPRIIILVEKEQIALFMPKQ